MKIKFIRGTMHLGYAERAGNVRDYPDKVAEMFIKGKYAVPFEERKREYKPKVKTTDVKRSTKRPVKK